MMKKWSRVLVAAVLSVGLSVGYGQQVNAMVGGKPVIGISWKGPNQAKTYEAFRKIITMAGGVPVELDQIRSEDVKYDASGVVDKADLEPSGMLKQSYADKIKKADFARTNVETVMQGVDGVFGTGGADISPSLYKNPEKEKNHGEAIDAARDVSDYTLQAYCRAHNIPILNVCRSEQMMGVVYGASLIQDIPDYYKANGITSYKEIHRMPVGTPNRDYAHHDVHIFKMPSHLREIVGADTIKNVSSWHHQNILSVKGTDLVQTAECEDQGLSLIEGVEDPSRTFAVGLQFHPENDIKNVVLLKKDPKGFADPDTCLKFFKALVAAAKKS
jgi:putative glutamine amidotransferase